MAPATERLLSAPEVADFLGVPLSTIYQWRYLRRGPRSYKVGKHLKFRHSEVIDWLDRQAPTGGQPGAA